MNIRRLSIVLCILATTLLSSCYYEHNKDTDRWDLTEDARDSIEFLSSHHYTCNYNFKVSTDSLRLQVQPPLKDIKPLFTDSITVYRSDELVVADIMTLPADSVDSVWIKVAHNQEIMGWTHEKTLLSHVVPDDPISRFIHMFSNQHLLYAIVLLGVLLLVYLVRTVRRRRIPIVHFNDIDSFYPTLLCLLVSGAATLYSSIQLFAPETWREFYFQPTLNPFGLPFILSAFLITTWSILLVGIAVLDDVHHLLGIADGTTYLFGLAGMCVVDYLFFTLTTLYYVGFFFLALYYAFAVYRYFAFSRCKYVCGACGHKIQRKGECPYCGALNA
jgi:hypothetical protein